MRDLLPKKKGKSLDRHGSSSTAGCRWKSTWWLAMEPFFDAYRAIKTAIAATRPPCEPGSSEPDRPRPGYDDTKQVSCACAVFK